MTYRGEACEILGTKEVFGQEIAWIRLLGSGTLLQVPKADLKENKIAHPIAFLRFVSLAAKIKHEVAQKNIIAPYESSLIPLPHQILVLEKVMKANQNRFMLADEVGMGKTIETGLILKELKIRDEIERTLIIVPKSSMLQWQSELKEHFNEVFHIYDSEMITSMARTFSNIHADEEYNFWRQHNQIIVSTDALKPLTQRQGWTQERIDEYNKYRMEAVLDADFDLVIIDEAHKMGGANPTVSRYILAQELCNTIPNAFLLTATPHRGKADHFRRILQLLDPDAFAGEGLPSIAELEPYVIRTEKRLAVDYEGKKLFNERITRRLEVEYDAYKHQKQIELYSSVTEYVRTGFNAARRSRNRAQGLIMVLFQRLVSSSTQAILSTMEKRLYRLQNGGLLDEEEIEDLELDWEEELEHVDFDGFYADEYSEPQDEEQVLKRLISMAEDCLTSETDAKAEFLLKEYERHQQEKADTDIKILVFTEFRTTQKMLVEFFRRKGLKVSFIHGGQDIDERKSALVKFKNETQIMIATDAAGESLNMQFCHIVYNYDLPWNPMKIEQRIGRVDRIGQKYQVEAYNLLLNNSIDARVYEVIVTKLDNILNQLGIDKTSDVLDSTMDVKKVHDLYLQSLLDPKKFEFAGDKWLHEIKGKLREFKSTEGILPEVREEEIQYKTAADVKYSPLPYWLEALIQENVKVNNGDMNSTSLGFSEVIMNGQKTKITFDAEVALEHPDVEHISLKHDWIKKLLNQVNDLDTRNGLFRLRSKNADETAGYWSLWEVSAKNSLGVKYEYPCFFQADNGKQYAIYANDIWQRLIDDDLELIFEGNVSDVEWLKLKQELQPFLYVVFQKMQNELQEKLTTKRANKLNAFEVQENRINRIGIPNIKKSKLNRLKKERQVWQEEFESKQSVIPGSKLLMVFRIDE